MSMTRACLITLPSLNVCKLVSMVQKQVHIWLLCLVFVPVTIISTLTSLTKLHSIHLEVKSSLCVTNIKNSQHLLASEFFRLSNGPTLD